MQRLTGHGLEERPHHEMLPYPMNSQPIIAMPEIESLSARTKEQGELLSLPVATKSLPRRGEIRIWSAGDPSCPMHTIARSGFGPGSSTRDIFAISTPPQDSLLMCRGDGPIDDAQLSDHEIDMYRLAAIRSDPGQARDRP